MVKKTVKETTENTESNQNVSVDQPVTQAEPPALEIPNAITVAGLADMMQIGSIDLIKQLMRLGHMYTINDVLEFELAADVAESFYAQLCLDKTTANIITVDGGNIEASLR